MADFESEVEFQAVIDSGSLSDARATVEDELGDVGVNVDAVVESGSMGGGGGGPSGTARGQRAGILDASRQQLEVTEAGLELDEERNELLEQLAEETDQQTFDRATGAGGAGGFAGATRAAVPTAALTAALATTGMVGAGVAAGGAGVAAGRELNERMGLVDNETINQVGGPGSIQGSIIQAGSIAGGALAESLGIREEVEAVISDFRDAQLFDVGENVHTVIEGLKQIDEIDIPEPPQSLQTVAGQLDDVVSGDIPGAPGDLETVAKQLDGVVSGDIPGPPQELLDVASTLDNPDLRTPPWVDELIRVLSGGGPNGSDDQPVDRRPRNPQTDQQQMQVDVGGVTVDVTDYQALRRSLEEDLLGTLLDEISRQMSGL